MTTIPCGTIPAKANPSACFCRQSQAGKRGRFSHRHDSKFCGIKIATWSLISWATAFIGKRSPIRPTGWAFNLLFISTVLPSWDRHLTRITTQPISSVCLRFLKDRPRWSWKHWPIACRWSPQKSGNIPQMLDNGNRGILVPTQNAEALAQAIVTIIDNKEFRQRCIHEGFNFARQHHVSTFVARMADTMKAMV